MSLQPLPGGFSPSQGKSKEQLDLEGSEEKEEKVQKKVKGNISDKRVRKSKRKQEHIFLNIFSTKAASLVHPFKQYSLKQALKITYAMAFNMQVTCFKTKGTFKVHDFNIFKAIQAKENSGIIIGAHKSLSPV